MTIVDACTYQGKGGSPTAVLLDDGTLDDAARRAVVRDAGTSHAAFVAGDAVRFFTTHGELTNCGHGTLAAQAFLLHRSGRAEHHGSQRTGGRTFATTAVRRADGIEVWFDQGVIALPAGVPAGLDAILGALGVGPDDLAGAPAAASPGTPRLLVPVKAVHSIRPDLARLAAGCRRHGYLGCFVYTMAGDRAVARMFAPAIGVGEDIVNANSAGCLAAHLHATRGRSRIEVEQGHAAGRPSLVLATMRGPATWIGGTCRITG